MRSKFFSLILSVFLIGLGSAIFFFEISEYNFDDGKGLMISDPVTLTNTYGLEGIDRIDSYGAKLIIDDTQEGVKVELKYDVNLTKANLRTYAVITDCVIESHPLCDLLKKDKVTTLVVNYDYTESRFNLKSAVNILIEEAKKKTIVNVFNLATPQIEITVSSANMGIINY